VVAVAVKVVDVGVKDVVMVFVWVVYVVSVVDVVV